MQSPPKPLKIGKRILTVDETIRVLMVERAMAIATAHEMAHQFPDVSVVTAAPAHKAA